MISRISAIRQVMGGRLGMNRGTQLSFWRRFFGMVGCVVLISGQTVSIASAQERFKEPLHRVAKAKLEGMVEKINSL